MIQAQKSLKTIMGKLACWREQHGQLDPTGLTRRASNSIGKLVKRLDDGTEIERKETSLPPST